MSITAGKLPEGEMICSCLGERPPRTWSHHPSIIPPSGVGSVYLGLTSGSVINGKLVRNPSFPS